MHGENLPINNIDIGAIAVRSNERAKLHAIIGKKVGPIFLKRNWGDEAAAEQIRLGELWMVMGGW
jgi:hypothetical protein